MTTSKSGLDPTSKGSPFVADSSVPIAPPYPDLPVSPNPWNDVASASTDETANERAPVKSLNTLDPSLYDQPIFAGLKEDRALLTTSEPKNEGSREVLSEFDPLVSHEEKAAREAWETSEGHPPPPSTPPPPPLPLKDLYISSPTSPEASSPDTIASAPSTTAITSSSSFPSFAALAKTFSIPLGRSRPPSIDATAKAMLSPSTSSPFATQHGNSPPDRLDTAKSSASRSEESSTLLPSGSGTVSPIPKPTDGAFDFQRFLDQMKTKSADPVSRYLRSFLSNFAKRTFTVNDQVKIINDFLNFIAAQMRECDVWKNVTDIDFENAMEGMEKIVMNRLYEFTFTPQVAHANPPRPITTDDLERDRVLSQRIALFGWLDEKHLDIPKGEGSNGFLIFAQQELLKINHYKAPRDKLICVLNSCKVIYGLIRHLHNDEGADSFIPILIYVVVKANPEHLLSNVEFINRFRNPIKLQSEAGYYLSSLIGAVSFIETMDHTSLSNITQEEFENNVEEAIQALPASEPHSPALPFVQAKAQSLSALSPHAGEESAQLLAISAPSQTLSDDALRLLQKTGDTISKPLNAIGRIFSEALDGAENKLSYLPGPFAPFELGRENRAERPPELKFPSTPSEASRSGQSQATSSSAPMPQTPYRDGAYTPPLQTPYKPRVRRVPSPSLYPSSPMNSPGYGPEETPSRPGPYTHQSLAIGPSQQMLSQTTLLPPRVQSLVGSEGPHISRTPTPALDFAGVQAQIDSAHEQAATAARETLIQIFPAVDVEVINLVLEANDGDLGKSIEGLLDMSGGS